MSRWVKKQQTKNHLISTALVHSGLCAAPLAPGGFLRRRKSKFFQNHNTSWVSKWKQHQYLECSLKVKKQRHLKEACFIIIESLKTCHCITCNLSGRLSWSLTFRNSHFDINFFSVKFLKESRCEEIWTPAPI